MNIVFCNLLDSRPEWTGKYYTSQEFLWVFFSSGGFFGVLRYVAFLCYSRFAKFLHEFVT